MIGPRLTPDRGPNVTLPLRYLVGAAIVFLVAAAGVPWLRTELTGHYYNPRVLALAHTVALGWITLAIIGASYQLIPIVLQRPLWSERLARWQFLALAAGIIGMVGHFYLGSWAGLPWAVGLVGAGVATHLLNVTLTVRGVGRWSFTTWLVAGAHAGLALTVLFGLALAMSRVGRPWRWDALAAVHAHLHLALLGWVAPMMLGVAARVFPMFLLAPEPGGPLDRVQLGGLALGVPAVVLGLLGLPPLVVPGALLVVAALLAHVAWVAGMLRQRRRPALDWGLRCVLTGTAFLLPAAGLGLALAFGRLAGPRAALAYAVLAFGGWVSLSIVGMMLKIVPFLTWHRRYAPQAGRGPVPTLAQLGWPAAETVAWTCLTSGIIVLASAVATASAALTMGAGGLLAIGAAAFAAALARVLAHLTAPSRPHGPASAATRPGPAAWTEERPPTTPAPRPVTPDSISRVS